MARILPMISAVAGTGKTFVAAHLARMLADAGRSCIVGVADPLQGLAPWMDGPPGGDLKAVLAGSMDVGQAVCRLRFGADLLVDGGALGELHGMPADGRQRFEPLLADTSKYDYLLLDLPWGLDPVAVAACMAVGDAWLVLGLDSQNLTAAFDLLRGLGANGFDGTVKVVFNRVKRLATAQAAFDKFRSSAARYLSCPMELAAVVRHDAGAKQAVAEGKLLGQVRPDSAAASDLKALADAIGQEVPTDRQAMALADFLDRFSSAYRRLLPSRPPGGTAASQLAPPRQEQPAQEPADMPESHGRSDADALQRIAASLEKIAEHLAGLSPAVGASPGAVAAGTPVALAAEELDWEGFVRRRKAGRDKGNR